MNSNLVATHFYVKNTKGNIYLGKCILKNVVW